MKTVCSICMDCIDLLNIGTLTAAPCGHVFHESCLLKWLESTKSCPTCRKPTRQKQTLKLYFDAGDCDDIDLGRLQNKLNAAEAEVQSMNTKVSRLVKDLETCKTLVVMKETEAEKYKDKYMVTLGELSTARMQTKTLRKEVSEKRALSEQVESLHNRLSTYENVKKIVEGTTKEAEEILNSYGEGFGAINQLATYCVLLKRELQAANDSRTQLRQQLGQLRKEVGFKTSRLAEREASVKKLQAEAGRYRDLLEKAEAKLESRKKLNLCDELLAESPAPERLKRPRLTNPEETPSPHVPSPSLRVVSNAWRPKSSSFSQERSPSPVVQPPFVLGANYFKQKPETDSFISISRTGYNGLGGHSKHIIPSKKQK